MATSMCRKHKRVVLSSENKLSILDRLAKGERATKIASEFGIGNSTVTDIKKNESSIRSFVSTMESLSVSSKERKIMRLADDEKVDEAVYLWYVQKRSQGIPITGPILREKAQLFYQQLHGDSYMQITVYADNQCDMYVYMHYIVPLL